MILCLNFQLRAVLLSTVLVLFAMIAGPLRGTPKRDATCHALVVVAVPSRRQHRPASSSVPKTRLDASGPAGVDSNVPSSLPPTLRVAVVGAGPSGLLLSHLILKQNGTFVTLIEGRPDSREAQDVGQQQRAYALGVGIRGRTAIRRVDEELWRAVKRRGYESERFQVHVGGWVVPLRSEGDGTSNYQGDGDDNNGAPSEPSLLLYQSALCAAMMDELEVRFQSSGRFQCLFDTKVDRCDLQTMSIRYAEPKKATDSYDLIVGCDGVNSVVREAIQASHPGFEYVKERLPGEFKVVRLDEAPPTVDPKSVSLVLPRAGSTTAFVEPTGMDGSCCILFAGKSDSIILSETKNVTAIVEALETGFPQWTALAQTLAEQLVREGKPGVASSVVCNTYHYTGKAVLVGDAAHATGGVSGQGVNSALQDCVALSDCIFASRHDLPAALLLYSTRQVPEGKALYDLSFGPKPTGFKALVWAFRNARDALFRGRFGIGKPPLQTRLTTTLKSFSEIRRESDEFYAEPFPKEEEFQQNLIALHHEAVTKDKGGAIIAEGARG